MQQNNSSPKLSIDEAIPKIETLLDQLKDDDLRAKRNSKDEKERKEALKKENKIIEKIKDILDNNNN